MTVPCCRGAVLDGPIKSAQQKGREKLLKLAGATDQLTRRRAVERRERELTLLKLKAEDLNMDLLEALCEAEPQLLLAVVERVCAEDGRLPSRCLSAWASR